VKSIFIELSKLQYLLNNNFCIKYQSTQNYFYLLIFTQSYLYVQIKIINKYIILVSLKNINHYTNPFFENLCIFLNNDYIPGNLGNFPSFVNFEYVPQPFFIQ